MIIQAEREQLDADVLIRLAARSGHKSRLSGGLYGGLIDLKGQPAHLEENHDFVADCCRYQEGILSEATLKKKYHYTDEEAIEAEKIRRIRTGQQKRECAQQSVTKAPDIMSTIMLDANVSPRHRIDSAQALDAFAATRPEGVPAADRFQITINLGGDSDVLRFNKSINIDPNDTDPNDTNHAPQGLLPRTCRRSALS